MNQLFAKTKDNLQKPKEGDLYKVIVAHGKQFEIYYGFYEEIDRQNPLAEPMEIYPNFAKHPQYTRDGFAFATAMQTPCKHFLLGRGARRRRQHLHALPTLHGVRRTAWRVQMQTQQKTNLAKNGCSNQKNLEAKLYEKDTHNNTYGAFTLCLFGIRLGRLWCKPR
ncbi:MAG: hypothetical protein IJD18_04835 [Clostridia bacterium]|nr:hypothetical protein [Clostridia bacterium]